MVNLGAEHENLDHKVYLILRKMIIDRKLLPGEKIPQENLVQDLGISRESAEHRWSAPSSFSNKRNL